MAIEYRGEKFAGYNKPKRTPNHPNKSHAVLAKEGDKVNLTRCGQQGESGPPVERVNQPVQKPAANHFKLVTQRTSQKARCPLRTGRTKLNGDHSAKIGTK